MHTWTQKLVPVDLSNYRWRNDKYDVDNDDDIAYEGDDDGDDGECYGCKCQSTVDSGRQYQSKTWNHGAHPCLWFLDIIIRPSGHGLTT